MTTSTDSETTKSVNRLALLGNPNTGKTTLFNALTGLSQRTGNYPGVTVDKKTGAMAPGVEIIDLPGTYSLAGRSPDELISIQVLLGQIEEQRPDLALVVADACQLKRSCYLVNQVMELGLPVLLVVNMMDLANKSGISIDIPKLKSNLGIEVVATIANQARSLGKLKSSIDLALKSKEVSSARWSWPEAFEQEVSALNKELNIKSALIRRVLIDDGLRSGELIANRFGVEALDRVEEARAGLKSAGLDLARIEAEIRHGWIEQHIAPTIQCTEQSVSFTERLDSVLLHKFFGTFAFFALMTLVFMAIFDWAGPVMDLISDTVDSLGQLAAAGLVAGNLAGGALESLVVQGIIAGVGGVLVFLPQIALLFFFLAILEDCGYMARAAFLMDRLLRFSGLSGHSFVPLMSSFACAIPGIMATRTISSRSERLATILIAPLMSCSARIPVYTLMIAAFIPHTKVAGLFPLQALVFTGMYLLGICCAIPIALLVRRFSTGSEESSFLMELPTYKVPSAKTVLLRVVQASKAFIVRAGTVIFVASILIWALSYFPRSADIQKRHQALRTEARSTERGEALESRLADINRLEQGAYLRSSYLGQLGHFIEPAVKPLGWDWTVGVAVLASFPAREVVISVFGIIYDLGDEIDTGEQEGSKALTDKLSAARWSDDSPVFNLPVALSIMVFFALCMQCAATVATIKQETKSWFWPLLSFAGMTALAYIGALIAYQGGMALGLGTVG
jgi:ferrous iron transport protein B